MHRTARVERATKETKILVELGLDGTGTSASSTVMKSDNLVIRKIWT